MLVEQMDRDGKIKQLISVLSDIYAFVGQAGVLGSIVDSQQVDSRFSVSNDIVKGQLKTLKAILEHTSECAHFILGYMGEKNFGM